MWRRRESDSLFEWEWLGTSGGETRLIIHRYASGHDWTNRYEIEFRRTRDGRVKRETVFSSDCMDDIIAVANWYMDEWERRHGCIAEPPERTRSE